MMDLTYEKRRGYTQIFNLKHDKGAIYKCMKIFLKLFSIHLKHFIFVLKRLIRYEGRIE